MSRKLPKLPHANISARANDSSFCLSSPVEKFRKVCHYSLSVRRSEEETKRNRKRILDRNDRVTESRHRSWVDSFSLGGMAMLHQATISSTELWNPNVPRLAGFARASASIRNCSEILWSLTSRHLILSNLRMLQRAPSFQAFQSLRAAGDLQPVRNLRRSSFRFVFQNMIRDRNYIHVENRAPSGRRIIRSEADHPDQRGSEKKIKKSTGLTSLELENGGSSKIKNSYNGIFLLLLLNLGIYALDHWFHFPVITHLYLHHHDPKWYQFITATFCHINWTHLSSNLFFLYIFGKLIEEEEGGFAVWFSYLITGVGANLVSWLLLPRTVISAGASGAVFGLFAVSVLVKMSFDWRKILEVLILGQFVVEKVMEEAQASASMGSLALKSSMNINHIAHLSGALLGVALICLLNRLPSGDPDKK